MCHCSLSLVFLLVSPEQNIGTTYLTENGPFVLSDKHELFKLRSAKCEHSQDHISLKIDQNL